MKRMLSIWPPATMGAETTQSGFYDCMRNGGRVYLSQTLTISHLYLSKSNKLLH
jgi:hypothetical protein